MFIAELTLIGKKRKRLDLRETVKYGILQPLYGSLGAH